MRRLELHIAAQRIFIICSSFGVVKSVNNIWVLRGSGIHGLGFGVVWRFHVLFSVLAWFGGFGVVWRFYLFVLVRHYFVRRARPAAVVKIAISAALTAATFTNRSRFREFVGRFCTSGMSSHMVF